MGRGVLIAEGAGPDSRVAICVERSFEIRRSGLGDHQDPAPAFVPIDPSLPE